MEFLTGHITQEPMIIGETCRVKGMVHTIRNMGNIAFVILRKREGLLQGVYKDDAAGCSLKEIKEGDTIEIEGVPVANEKAPGGIEIPIEKMTVLSKTGDDMLPLPIAKSKLNTSLEAKLNYRPIALRNLRERAKFRIQEGIVRAFRDYLYAQGFTEIHTPKIAKKGAEGGSNMFKLDYFHTHGVLSQSPQFYKQMMVGVFDRVFETAPVFRAEKHNTKRHLNEYTSLDFEMGYIDSFEDIMEMETGYLQSAMELLKTDYKKELDLLSITLPDVGKIPVVKFKDIKELAAQKYGHKIKNPYDLEPEEEVLIGRYAKEVWDSDFVFVTHYPTKKRPFYAMEDPEDRNYTLSFDLLFRGLEITTGGQRIHNYRELFDKIEKKGMTTEGMEDYLEAFEFGMPPHGGLGIGLERLTMQICEEDNIRETTLFPRDLSRLTP